MAGEREQEVTMTSETEAREIAEIRKIICECDPDGPHSADCEYETAAILAYGDKRAGEMRERAAGRTEEAGVWIQKAQTVISHPGVNLPKERAILHEKESLAHFAESIATAIRALPERTEP